MILRTSFFAPCFLHLCEEGDISFLEDCCENFSFFFLSLLPDGGCCERAKHLAVIDLFVREN